ncbi:MAG: CDP-alcohol phosphatidyltransferase family protein [Oscillospiraceae bacterium]|nr:CDP-alcohol phosphatidyltransferase family protein [Methanosarcinaceae archaeon]MBQ5973472.1 CDP-alcohol phosphatidyltransferase family protein [Oscillospiraceae bacterium]
MIGFYNYTVILTYLGLASGAVGLGFGAAGQSFPALVCLLFSGLCDMFDGAVARTRKRTEAEKRFGIWIDSLSDTVCFGVLPAMIGFSVGMDRWYFFPVFAVYILCAVIRLAYYGVTEEQRQEAEGGKRTAYDGMPVTTAAVIFPAVWVVLECIKPSSLVSGIVYGAVMLLTACAFVGKFQIKKPGKKGILLFIAIGVLLAGAMIALYLL